MSDLHTSDWYTDQSLIEDPFTYYEAVHAQGPIYREPNHGAFVVTGYDETATIYRDTESFSSCNSFSGPFPPLPGAPYGDDVSELIEEHRDLYTGHDSLVTEDPPLHTDHRGLLLRLLTPARLQENEEFMWRMADNCIDTFVDRGRCDFIGGVCTAVLDARRCRPARRACGGSSQVACPVRPSWCAGSRREGASLQSDLVPR